MKFKVILAMVNEEHQDKVIQGAKSAGATGVTILNARGEGIRGQKSFFGLNVEAQREVLLFLVEDFNSDRIMEFYYCKINIIHTYRLRYVLHKWPKLFGNMPRKGGGFSSRPLYLET